jgi:4-hydroxy-tetrahydrodipicolinate reductase
MLTTSSALEQCAPVLRELVTRGKSVVSSCEELSFPWARHRELADELHSLAVVHEARVLGTGVNPGFLMDALPVFATGVCRNVRNVNVWRIQDATTRRIPFQKKIGAGLDLAQFAERSRAGTLRHVGLCESIHFLAHCLNWKLESWDETLEPVVAERDLTAGVGPIPAGHAAGVRQVGRGFARGREVLRLEFQASIGQSDPHDRVLIDGDPPIDLVLRGGVHGDTATSAILLNTIRPLLSAAPGLHTMATIPMACSTGV